MLDESEPVRTLGALPAPHWHRPFLRYLEGDQGGGPGAEGGTEGAAAAGAGAAGAEGAEGAPPPPAVDPQVEALKREMAALKDKADKWDAAEQEKLSDIEKATQRATAAEQTAAKEAAEKLQLQAAVDNGITKDERVLLTATTEEGLAAQVKAILSMRAPGTASAAAAGITGGGAAPSNKPATLEAAIEAAFAAKK